MKPVCWCVITPVSQKICAQCRWYVANFGKRRNELMADRLRSAIQKAEVQSA